mmetsp:Transcript_31293/g.68526  ORF Transcript_31293/g.68526 Transcript_31293/m.68526 type:complete len:328 (-) Transcript_31293:115-1098(-)
MIVCAVGDVMIVCGASHGANSSVNGCGGRGRAACATPQVGELTGKEVVAWVMSPGASSWPVPRQNAAESMVTRNFPMSSASKVSSLEATSALTLALAAVAALAAMRSNASSLTPSAVATVLIVHPVCPTKVSAVRLTASSTACSTVLSCCATSPDRFMASSTADLHLPVALGPSSFFASVCKPRVHVMAKNSSKSTMPEPSSSAIFQISWSLLGLARGNCAATSSKQSSPLRAMSAASNLARNSATFTLCMPLRLRRATRCTSLFRLDSSCACRTLAKSSAQCLLVVAAISNCCSLAASRKWPLRITCRCNTWRRCKDNFVRKAALF